MGYEKYFTVLYAHNHVTITLKENLPENLFDDEYTLTLAVKAKVKKAESISSQAVLNIKLTGKSISNNVKRITNIVDKDSQT